MSGALFVRFVFAYPAILLEGFIDNFFGEWFGIISIVTFIGWVMFVASRAKKWP